MRASRHSLLTGAIAALLVVVASCNDSGDDDAETMSIEEICTARGETGTVNGQNSWAENKEVVAGTAAYFTDLSAAVSASDGPSDVEAAAAEVAERLDGVVDAPSNEDLQIELTAFWTDPAVVEQLEVLEDYIAEVCPTGRSLSP